jgi:hypothetical protein
MAEPALAPEQHPPVSIYPYGPNADPLNYFFSLGYQPIVEMSMFSLTLLLSHFGYIESPSQWPHKLIAASIIGIKWLHMFSSEFVRLVIASDPANAGAYPTYYGDLIYSQPV